MGYRTHDSVYRVVPKCKDCTSRYAGCHAECADYTKWRKEYDEYRKKILDEKNKNKCLTQAKREIIIKSKYGNV